MRFYIEEKNVDELSSKIFIDSMEDIIHISKSLRMREGDGIEICVPKKNVYNCKIESISKKKIFLDIINTSDITGELPFEVDLFQGIVKSTKWDFIIQKNVEFGISKVIPVMMSRSVSKLIEEKSNKKLERWQKISNSAAKQCFRGIIPRVEAPISFSEMIEMFKDYDLILVAYENEFNIGLANIVDEVKKGSKIGIVIGTEGGISDKEIQALRDYSKEHSNKVRIITLGQRILRCESAGMYLLAQLNYIGEINE